MYSEGCFYVWFVCVFHGDVQQGKFSGVVLGFKWEFAVSVDEEADYVGGSFGPDVADDRRRVRGTTGVGVVDDR